MKLHKPDCKNFRWKYVKMKAASPIYVIKTWTCTLGLCYPLWSGDELNLFRSAEANWALAHTIWAPKLKVCVN